MPEVNEVAVGMLREMLARAEAGEITEVTIVAHMPEDVGAREVVASCPDPRAAMGDGLAVADATRALLYRGSRQGDHPFRMVVAYDTREAKAVRWERR